MNNFLEFVLFLDFLIWGLSSNHNFELFQSLLNLFLIVHSELITVCQNVSVFQKLNLLKDLQKLKWKNLDDLFKLDLSFVKILSNLN
jgi:hypothetical protein